MFLCILLATVLHVTSTEAFQLERDDDGTNTTHISFRVMYSEVPGRIYRDGNFGYSTSNSSVWLPLFFSTANVKPASRFLFNFTEDINETNFWNQVMCTKPEAPDQVRVEAIGEMTAKIYYEESDRNEDRVSGVLFSEQNNATFFPPEKESGFHFANIYNLEAFTKYRFYVQQKFECCCSFDSNLPIQYFQDGYTLDSEPVYANWIRTYPREGSLAVVDVGTTSATLQFSLEDFDYDVELVLYINSVEFESFHHGNYEAENTWNPSGLDPGSEYTIEVKIHDKLGENSVSSTVSFMTLPDCPQAEIEVSEDQELDVFVRIFPPSTGDWDSFKIVVFAGDALEQTLSVEGTETTVALSLTSFGTSYTIQVKSLNAEGNACANPYNETFQTAAEPAPKNSDDSNSTTVIIVIAVVLSVLLVLGILLAILFYLRLGRASKDPTDRLGGASSFGNPVAEGTDNFNSPRKTVVNDYVEAHWTNYGSGSVSISQDAQDNLRPLSVEYANPYETMKTPEDNSGEIDNADSVCGNSATEYVN